MAWDVLQEDLQLQLQLELEQQLGQALGEQQNLGQGRCRARRNLQVDLQSAGQGQGPAIRTRWKALCFVLLRTLVCSPQGQDEQGGDVVLDRAL